MSDSSSASTASYVPSVSVSTSCDTQQGDNLEAQRQQTFPATSPYTNTEAIQAPANDTNMYTTHAGEEKQPPLPAANGDTVENRTGETRADTVGSTTDACCSTSGVMENQTTTSEYPASGPPESENMDRTHGTTSGALDVQSSANRQPEETSNSQPLHTTESTTGTGTSKEIQTKVDSQNSFVNSDLVGEESFPLTESLISDTPDTNKNSGGIEVTSTCDTAEESTGNSVADCQTNDSKAVSRITSLDSQISNVSSRSEREKTEEVTSGILHDYSCSTSSADVTPTTSNALTNLSTLSVNDTSSSPWTSTATCYSIDVPMSCTGGATSGECDASMNDSRATERQLATLKQLEQYVSWFSAWNEDAKALIGKGKSPSATSTPHQTNCNHASESAEDKTSSMSTEQETSTTLSCIQCTVSTARSQDETARISTQQQVSTTLSCTPASVATADLTQSKTGPMYTQQETSATASYTPSSVTTARTQTKTFPEAHRIGRVGQNLFKKSYGFKHVHQFVEDSGPKLPAIKDALPLFDTIGLSRVEVYRLTSSALIHDIKSRLDMLEPKRLWDLYAYTAKFSKGSQELYPLLAALVEKFPHDWADIITEQDLFGFPEMLPPEKRLRVWTSKPQLLERFLNEVVEEYSRPTSQFSRCFDLISPPPKEKASPRQRPLDFLGNLLSAIGENVDLYNLICFWLVKKYRSTNNPLFLMVRVDLYGALQEKKDKLQKRDRDTTATTQHKSSVLALERILNQDPHASLVKALLSGISAYDHLPATGHSAPSQTIINAAKAVAGCMKRFRDAHAQAAQTRRQQMYDAVKNQTRASAITSKRKVPNVWRNGKVLNLRDALNACLERLIKKDQDNRDEFTKAPWVKYPDIKKRYLEKITQPMYLQKMVEQLDEYTSFDQVEDDVKLIVNNCEEFEPSLVPYAKAIMETFRKERKRLEKQYHRYCQMMEAEYGENPLKPKKQADGSLKIESPEEEAYKDTQLQEFAQLQTAISLLSEPRFRIALSRVLKAVTFEQSKEGKLATDENCCILLLSVTERLSFRRWALVMECQYKNGQTPPVLQQDWCSKENVEKVRLLETAMASEMYLAYETNRLKASNGKSEDLVSSYASALEETVPYLARSSQLGFCLALHLICFPISKGWKSDIDPKFCISLCLRAIENGMPCLLRPLLESLTTLESSSTKKPLTRLSDIDTELAFETLEELLETGLLETNIYNEPPKTTFPCMDFSALVCSLTDAIWVLSFNVASVSRADSGSNVGALDYGTKPVVLRVLGDWFPRLMLAARHVAYQEFACAVPWRTLCLPLVHHCFGTLLTQYLRYKYLSESEGDRLLQRALLTLNSGNGKILRIWNSNHFQDARTLYDNLCCTFLSDFDRSRHGLGRARHNGPVMSPWGQQIRYKTPKDESRRSFTRGTPHRGGMSTFSPADDRASRLKRSPADADDTPHKRARYS